MKSLVFLVAITYCSAHLGPQNVIPWVPPVAKPITEDQLGTPLAVPFPQSFGHYLRTPYHLPLGHKLLHPYAHLFQNITLGSYGQVPYLHGIGVVSGYPQILGHHLTHHGVLHGHHIPYEVDSDDDDDEGDDADVDNRRRRHVDDYPYDHHHDHTSPHDIPVTEVYDEVQRHRRDVDDVEDLHDHDDFVFSSEEYDDYDDYDDSDKRRRRDVKLPLPYLHAVPTTKNITIETKHLEAVDADTPADTTKVKLTTKERELTVPAVKYVQPHVSLKPVTYAAVSPSFFHHPGFLLHHNHFGGYPYPAVLYPHH